MEVNIPEPLFPVLAHGNVHPSGYREVGFHSRHSKMVTPRLVICRIEQWTAPSGESFDTHLSLHCPECNHPIVVALSSRSIEGAMPNHELPGGRALSIRHRLACPAHWQKVDAMGLVEDGPHERCCWTAVVRNGIAHRPNCAEANFNRPLTDRERDLGVVGDSCDCGARRKPQGDADPPLPHREGCPATQGQPCTCDLPKRLKYLRPLSLIGDHQKEGE